MTSGVCEPASFTGFVEDIRQKYCNWLVIIKVERIWYLLGEGQICWRRSDIKIKDHEVRNDVDLSKTWNQLKKINRKKGNRNTVEFPRCRVFTKDK